MILHFKSQKSDFLSAKKEKEARSNFGSPIVCHLKRGDRKGLFLKRNSFLEEIKRIAARMPRVGGGVTT